MPTGTSRKVGDKIGRLEIIDFAVPNKCGAKQYLCKCNCGKIELKGSSNIKRAEKLDTGCSDCGKSLKSLRKQTHGDTTVEKSDIYNKWSRMRHRCNNSNATQYKWYGGKGVKVCDEWQDYLTFKKWCLENGYEEGLTIDRIDSSGNYEPSNCRFITHSENSRLARLTDKRYSNVSL